MIIRELLGSTFGKLKVVAELDRKNGNRCWKCICACGKVIVRPTKTLVNGQSNSCGCLRTEAITKHGHAPNKAWSGTYKAWAAMRGRCNTKSDVNYPRYGGRGIKVCARWNNFTTFLNDMGERPSPKHSIDRINNDGNYEPKNCRWATRKEQDRNTSRNVWLTVGNKTLCVKDWAVLTGRSEKTIRRRLRAGMSPEEIIL